VALVIVLVVVLVLGRSQRKFEDKDDDEAEDDWLRLCRTFPALGGQLKWRTRP